MIVIGANPQAVPHVGRGRRRDGQTRGQLTIAASDQGELDALRFASSLDSERVWAIEDSRHVSSRPEGTLVAAGERVVRVTP